MTPREFSLLARRHNREQEASWQRAALIAHTIYSLHAGERAPRLTLADFMPSAQARPRRSSPGDLLAQARALQLAFTTVPERQRTQRPSPRGR